MIAYPYLGVGGSLSGSVLFPVELHTIYLYLTSAL